MQRGGGGGQEPGFPGNVGGWIGGPIGFLPGAPPGSPGLGGLIGSLPPGRVFGPSSGEPPGAFAGLPRLSPGRSLGRAPGDFFGALGSTVRLPGPFVGSPGFTTGVVGTAGFFAGSSVDPGSFVGALEGASPGFGLVSGLVSGLGCGWLAGDCAGRVSAAVPGAVRLVAARAATIVSAVETPLERECRAGKPDSGAVLGDGSVMAVLPGELTRRGGSRGCSSGTGRRATPRASSPSTEDRHSFLSGLPTLPIPSSLDPRGGRTRRLARPFW